MSRAVQNFPQESAELLNAQVNMELYAAYSYFAMANYCTQDDVALPGLACFFTKSYKEELEHANMLSTYLLKRGGTLTCSDVKAPPHKEWNSAEKLVQTALDLERKVNDSLININKSAEKNGDYHLTELIQSEFLAEQIESIKLLSDMLTELQRAGTSGLGLYLYDQYLLAKHK